VSILPIYFIGQCLSLDEHPTFRETIILQFSDPGYDWNSFIWTCSNHLVLPVIYLKFLKYDLLGYLPEVLAQHLEDIYSLNRKRNEQILEQMKEINATLNAAGISPIYLKGTGNLIDGIYSDIGERIIGDIDLLVREDDYLKSVELAKEIGYINYWGEPNNPLKIKHYPRLYKEHVPADLEIHHIPVRSKYSKYFNSEMIFRQKTEVIGFPGCFVPGDEHKVVLNFIHSQLSNSGHQLGVVSLRDIYDLYLFSERVNVTTLFSQIPYKRKAGAYFTLAQKLLRTSIFNQQTLTSKIFIWKHDLNLSSPLFNTLNRIPWVISRIIFHEYPKQVKNAFIYKSDRQLLLRKLVNPKRYIYHLNVYKKMIN